MIIADEVLPPETVAFVLSELDGIVAEIVVAVRDASPVYGAVLAAPEGIGLRLGVEQAIRAFLAASAEGIIAAGFAPGMLTPADIDAVGDAIRAGVKVVLSTRAGSGVALDGAKLRSLGVLTADNLNPQKARILLALALTVTRDPDEIQRFYETY